MPPDLACGAVWPRECEPSPVADSTGLLGEFVSSVRWLPFLCLVVSVCVNMAMQVYMVSVGSQQNGGGQSESHVASFAAQVFPSRLSSGEASPGIVEVEPSLELHVPSPRAKAALAAIMSMPATQVQSQSSA